MQPSKSVARRSRFNCSAPHPTLVGVERVFGLFVDQSSFISARRQIGAIKNYPGSAVGLRHPAQQRANVFPRHAPILAFAPLKLFVLNGFAKSLKCVSRTDPVGPQILIDVSFNQEMPMRTLRACQDTQCGQARPEPAHSSSRISPHEHTL
jgi:hypothetical protein